MPEFVIKNTNSYACTNIDNFYEVFQIQRPKGCFPCEWFDSLKKLNYKGQPPQSDFYSALTDKSTSASWQSQFLGCLAETNIKHFVDYVGYHNNADVIGFFQGIEKMINVNIVKESVSCIFHTCLFSTKTLKNDYFSGIGEEN